MPQITLTHLIECKISDTKPHGALLRFAEQWKEAHAVQLVRNIRTEYELGKVVFRSAARWLSDLEA